jgi:hypothetical protein
VTDRPNRRAREVGVNVAAVGGELLEDFRRVCLRGDEDEDVELQLADEGGIDVTGGGGGQRFGARGGGYRM